MSAENHRLVILGSMDEFVDLVDCAKKRGIYTIVCDGYEDGPAKAHADKAHEGCDNIISVRFFMRYRPIKERNKYAICCGQKGVFSRSRIHKAVGLDNICRCKAYAH